MPLYFAYGSNMDETALRSRCPKARALGVARLPRHRFVLMGNGYASVHRDPASTVHGVLFDLALSDIAPLDRYEEIAQGLYTKLTQSILRATDGPCRALIYIGADETVAVHASIPGYMEAIVETARRVGLPTAYVTSLAHYLPHRSGNP